MGHKIYINKPLGSLTCYSLIGADATYSFDSDELWGHSLCYFEEPINGGETGTDRATYPPNNSNMINLAPVFSADRFTHQSMSGYYGTKNGTYLSAQYSLKTLCTYEYVKLACVKNTSLSTSKLVSMKVAISVTIKVTTKDNSSNNTIVLDSFSQTIPSSDIVSKTSYIILPIKSYYRYNDKDYSPKTIYIESVGISSAGIDSTTAAQLLAELKSADVQFYLYGSYADLSGDYEDYESFVDPDINCGEESIYFEEDEIEYELIGKVKLNYFRLNIPYGMFYSSGLQLEKQGSLFRSDIFTPSETIDIQIGRFGCTYGNGNLGTDNWTTQKLFLERFHTCSGCKNNYASSENEDGEVEKEIGYARIVTSIQPFQAHNTNYMFADFVTICILHSNCTLYAETKEGELLTLFSGELVRLIKDGSDEEIDLSEISSIWIGDLFLPDLHYLNDSWTGQKTGFCLGPRMFVNIVYSLGLESSADTQNRPSTSNKKDGIWIGTNKVRRMFIDKKEVNYFVADEDEE